MKAKLTSAKEQARKAKLLILAFMLLRAAAWAVTPPSTLRLEVSGNNMQNETVVYFDPAGSFLYDPMMDAPSLGVDPGYLNIVTCFDSIDFQIKALPMLTQSISIPVKVVTGVTGRYTIYLQDLQNVPSGACVLLHDHLTHNAQNMRDSSYTSIISDTETVSRFTLEITINVVNAVAGSFVNPTCKASADGKIIAGVFSNLHCNYFWKDSNNTIVKTSLNKAYADTLYFANAGYYHVDISPPNTCSNASYQVILQATSASHAAFTADTSSPTGIPVNFTNTSVDAASYWWDFGDGMGAADTNGSETYVTPGTYTVTLFAYGSACPDTSVYTQQITITEMTTQLISFTAVKTGEIVALNWETATEVNNDYFTIEKSDDGANYTVFTEVNGAGTSVVTQTYTSSDQRAGNAAFYRLKQTDFNGQSQYFPAVMVQTGTGNRKIAMNVFPNPNPGNRVGIGYKSKEAASLLIVDSYGRVHHSENILEAATDDERMLDLSLTLEPGIYTVQFITASDRTVKTLIVSNN
jgi:PKD repeat protein